MRVLILNGSHRRGKCTDTLLVPLVQALEAAGAQVRTIYLSELAIAPCVGCYACQDVLDSYGCVQRDDMYGVVDEIIAADCVLLATPIYSWYCTVPMKAMLDRTYGLNKYYGEETGPGLWAGKKLGLILACGYDIDYGTGPFETGIRRECEHSKLAYIGMLAERDLDNELSFGTPEAVAKAWAYAVHVLAALAQEA